MSAASPSPALYRWALATLAMTIILTVGIGGVVTSTETGMAYPTWPNINSQGLFNFFYASLAEDYGTGSALEHTHRQAGALVGILAIVCVVVAWRTRRELTRMAALVLALISLQGVLGAFRVLGEPGDTIFRYDDTNPSAEKQEYIAALRDAKEAHKVSLAEMAAKHA